MTSGATVAILALGVGLWRGAVVYFLSPTRAPPTQSAPHRTIMALCGAHWELMRGETGGVINTLGVTVGLAVQVIFLEG